MQLEGLVTRHKGVWQPSWRRVSICGACVSLQCAVSPSLAASSAKCPVVACPLLLPFSSLLLTPLYLGTLFSPLPLLVFNVSSLLSHSCRVVARRSPCPHLLLMSSSSA